MGLGISLWKGGHLEEGIQELHKAVKEPSFQELDSRQGLRIRIHLARALIDAGRLDEAETQVWLANDLVPEDGLVYHGLAEVRLAKGRKKEARELAELAFERGCPLTPELRNAVGFKDKTLDEGGEQ